MRRMAMAVFAGLAAASFAGPAQAGVMVSFLPAASYHDFDAEAPAVRASMLNEIRQTFEQLGAEYLKPSQNLKIEVLDITRAGMVDPRRPLGDLRIVSSRMPPPRIKVRYALMQNGKTILHAQETIADIDYLQNTNARFSSDPLVYEKETLRDWFAARFGGAAPGPRD
jgi:hypothetical protein